MSRQASRDTEPELLVRRRLHALGLRYRVHRRPIPELRRTADIVFSRARVAVFIDGCFWHGCPAHATAPKTNADWWAAKLARNIERDAETDAILADANWSVVRVWEHEEPGAAAARVQETLVAASAESARDHRGAPRWPTARS